MIQFRRTHIQDHLDEIFNKWQLLDDDIWCKLIIMERNRRIGKAYARVPIVTIDGSHTLSYDGYKLALNGFDNHDRDAKTEECRKRIGKGIRIKMDHFGNILIKRLSKSGVYIKEWLQPASTLNGSHGGHSSQLMPSRQQLIKNQNALLAAAINGNSGNPAVIRPGSQVSAFNATSVTPSSSSSGSSMEPPNDSAICDEVISVGGRLDQDKIYVMFDMKKFQANITQELCRTYPDKRKLEQQCFSIVGLARDADDILNLPCWVMVINIVAIEMLNERFPLMDNHHQHTGFPDTMLLDHSGGRRAVCPPQAPNFVSIFEQNNNTSNGNHHHNPHHRGQLLKEDQNGKEEDPYSLPANASSSDLKSSINDYGTNSGKNIGSLLDSANHARYYSSKRAEMYAHKKELSARNPTDASDRLPLSSELKQRSKSNCNIYGHNTKLQNGASHLGGNTRQYNNSSSIYSPGHMLVPLSGDSVPPKLPPRDFVKKTKSKSSSNVSYDGSAANMDPMHNESIYSTGMIPIGGSKEASEISGQQVDKMARKSKKNRFLESLKAPLELAKSSNRSASVMGAPIQAQQQAAGDATGDKKAGKGKGVGGKNGLKSFLSGSKNNNNNNSGKSAKEINSDDKGFKAISNKLSKHNNGKQQTLVDSGEADSVVDSNEDASDDIHQTANQTNSSTSASYNDDLDIPTPDYETDENIYALDTNYRGYSPQSEQPLKQDKQIRRSGVNSMSNKKAGTNGKAHNKEDLYYSGYRAHVPNQHSNGLGNGNLTSEKMLRENSRFVSHNANSGKMLAANNSKLYGRDPIYGSTTGLSAASIVGSRYRSASMQRYYPRGSSQVARSHQEMYDLDSENPYAMSGLHTGGIDLGNPYAATTVNGVGHRRRSVSKPFGLGPTGGAGNLHRVASSMANSNYDIGRSSSGIYGNNSSSSSSDYADWHPQMRKVNSSGYLNSIFKSHIATAGSPIDLFNNNHALNKNQIAGSGTGAYNNTGKHQLKQTRNYATSRTLKSAPPVSALSKQQQQHHQQQQQQQQKQKHHQVASSIVNGGPTYPSYDSSNGKRQCFD